MKIKNLFTTIKRIWKEKIWKEKKYYLGKDDYFILTKKGKKIKKNAKKRAKKKAK